MFRNADPLRVARCRELGAEVVLAEDVHAAFAEAGRIEREEGRSFVHPFEGPRTALGTATLGREFLEQCPDLEAVLVPIGGGASQAGLPPRSSWPGRSARSSVWSRSSTMSCREASGAAARNRWPPTRPAPSPIR